MGTLNPRPVPPLPNLFVAACIAFGVAVTWLAGSAWVVQHHSTSVRWRRWYKPKEAKVLPDLIHMLADGTLTVYGTGDSFAERPLDGSRPLPGRKDERRVAGEAWFVGLGEPDVRPPRSWGWRVDKLYTGQEHGGRAYAVYEGGQNGSVYFVAYDEESSRRRGYLGRHGRCAVRPPREDRFDMPLSSWLDGHWSSVTSRAAVTTGREEPEGWRARAYHPATLFVSDGVLYAVDFASMEVRRLAEAPGARQCGTLDIPRAGARIERHTDDPELKHAIALFDGSVVDVLALPGLNRIARYRVPDEVGRKLFWFHLTTGHTALFMPDFDGETEPAEAKLLWTAPDGAVVKRRTVPLRGGYVPIVEATKEACAPLVLPIPVAAFGVEAVLRHQFRERFRGIPNGAPPPISLVAWLLFSLICLLTLAAAALCAWWQRRYCQGGTWVWVPFVLLLGPAGLLGYLLHRPWPCLEPCPACGREAPRDRPACAHCGHDFPPAAETGTEIYDERRTGPG